MPEWFCFRTPFGGQGIKWPKTLLKSTHQHRYASFPLMSNKLSSVSCLLVGYEILRPFSNMLTTNHNYFCHNCQKFTEKVQQQLSSKVKKFSASFIRFLKFTQNFKGFEKKDHLHSSKIF